MKRTTENCALIKKMVRAGIGEPEREKNWCNGYTVSEDNDEPSYVCRECKLCAANESFGEEHT